MVMNASKHPNFASTLNLVLKTDKEAFLMYRASKKCSHVSAIG